MVCKQATSVLLILTLLFIVSSGGVNAWCITVKGTPSSYVCRASDGRQACDAECKESGYPYGGTCDPTDGCLCLMCQDQGPPHPHAL